jgi:hypothetical protein
MEEKLTAPVAAMVLVQGIGVAGMGDEGHAAGQEEDEQEE